MAATNDFGIVLNTTLNTSNVPKQLENLQAQLNKSSSTKVKMPVDIDTGKIIKDLNSVVDKEKIVWKNFFKEISTYKDELGNTFKDVKILDLKGNLRDEEIKQVTSSIKTLTTETHKWTNSKGEINNWTTSIDNLGQTVQTRTKQYVNNANELVTETSKFTRNSKGQWEQLGETIINVTDDFKRNSEVLSTETHKFVNSKGEVQTWTTTVDDAGKTVSIRSKEIVDNLGNVITTTSRLEAEAGKPFKKIGNDITKVSEILRETTSETTTRVGQITDTVNGVTRTFNGTITTMKKVSSNGEELTTVISKYTNDMGQAVERTETFNKAGVQVATTMRKISENSKGVFSKGTETIINADGSKSVTQYADGVATLTTNTREFTTALGDLVKETVVLNAQTGETINRNVELITDYKKQADETKKLNQYKQELTTTTREEYQNIQRNGETYKAIVKTIQEETHEYGTLTTTITTYKNALGETVVETKKTDAAGREVAQTTKTVTKELDNANKTIKDTSKSTQTLGQSLSGAFERLVRYTIAMLPIQMVRRGISEAIETVKEFDSALIEFRKVSDLAGESLTNYVAKLAEMGEVTGSTMQAMVEASTEFRKSGFSDEDSAKLASIAEKYRNIADEEISAGESASFIIAQMKAFNIEADQAEHIIDSVNEV